MSQTEKAIEEASKPTTTFLSHYGATFAGQGLILGLGTLTGILSARILGPSGRGEYAAIILWPTALMMVLSFGINQAVAYYGGKRAYSISELSTGSLVVGLVQSVLAVAIGLAIIPLVLGKYSATVRHLEILFVLFTPAAILSVFAGNLFQGIPDLLRFNIIRVMSPIAYFLGLVYVIASKRVSLDAVIYSQIASYVIALVVGVVLVAILLKPRFHWSRAIIPDLVHYGGRVQVTNIANYFNQRVDQLVLSLVVPPKQLGFYAVAVTVATGLTVFSQAAGIVTFSRGASQSPEQCRATIGVSFRAALAWLVASSALVYFLTPALIHLIFGSAFDGSILACRILLPGTVVLGLNQVLYNGASALGRPGLPSIAEGVSIALTAIGLYLLVPKYGYIGAAIVSSIAYAVSFVIMLVLAARLLELTPKKLFIGGFRSHA